MSGSPSSAPAFQPDLKDPDLYEARAPHDLFKRLRHETPVYWNPEADGAGFWALTRHADIVEVSRQPELFSSASENGGHRIFNENEVGLANAGESAIGIPFISRDPPSHGQYRKFVMPALTPNRLEGIEARISERCADLLDKIPLNEVVDIVPLLSAPLPLLTLADLLGAPLDLWPKLYDWTNAFVGEDDPHPAFAGSHGDSGRVLLFRHDLFELGGRGPGGHATLLANAEIDGSRSRSGFVAAHPGPRRRQRTTRNSINHTMAAFAAYPDQWDWLREDPQRLTASVREMVRFASPVMHMRRTAMADTEIGGQAIAKGDKVVMWYISGNRDEAVFDDADRFDVSRKTVPHIGFGTGQHVCVGWRLAELQLRVAFGLLAERVKRFEQVGQPRRFRSNFINGLKNLDVRLVRA
jgi:linalool 8-monooxygenase